VEVMEPTEYQRWLAGGSEGSLASQGEKLFQKNACNTCHTNDNTGRGPVLTGLYGSTVTLSDNRTVPADDNYIRESILNPQAKVVRGFAPIMPTFQGQLSEEDLLKLLAYVKSVGQGQQAVVPVESAQSMRTSAGAPPNTGAAPGPSAPPAGTPTSTSGITSTSGATSTSGSTSTTGNTSKGPSR